MKNQGLLLCLVGLVFSSGLFSTAQAAKKYYPPGFVPPSDQKLLPQTPSSPEPTPPATVPNTPVGKQVIIKTIAVEKIRPAKPRDPLLTLLDEHRYYDAYRVVSERLKKSPNNVSLQMLRGQILRLDGDFPQAIAQYNDILEKNKAKSAKSIRAGALNGLGWTYYQRAQYAQRRGNKAGFEAALSSADGNFRQATRLAPHRAYAWAGLAKVALSNQQLHEAEQWVKKAKNFGPNTLEVQLAEAELRLAQKKPEEALQLLYGIKKTTTREPEVFLLLAKASLETGKVDDAIINLKQMLQIVPEDAQGLKLLSQSYELKMKPEDAAQALEKAIALNPSDLDSVEALIKIYNQRQQSDRGVRLLKSLLEERPNQPYLAQMLLSRLLEAEQWDEAYREGLSVVNPILSDINGDVAAQQAVVNLFLQAAFQRGRGLINRLELLQDAPTAQALRFVQNRLNQSIGLGEAANSYDITNRLNWVRLDPLAKVPPLPESYTPTENQLGEALQLSFLQGSHAQYQRWLSQAKLNTSLSVNIARQLYSVGDYTGVETLLAGQSYPEASQKALADQLQRRVTSDRQLLKEHLASLSMLPKKISAAYWHNAATETLKVGNAQAQAHALVAQGLARRDQDALALLHQRLAAQYATEAKDQKYWRRQAEKNARHLDGSLATQATNKPKQ